MTFNPFSTVVLSYLPGGEPGTIVAQTDPFILASTSSAPNAGDLLLRRMYSFGGLASNFNMFVFTAGAVLGATFGCLVMPDGTILAQTADRSGDAALVAGSALWTAPFIAPVNLPAGPCYAGLLIAGATTMPAMGAFRPGTSAAAINAGKSIAR